ncbi:PCYCGC motif-containing (lipo)protein [Paenibacillus sp. B01]|uniref:PCYCGC motif-containing (lipo)protein n=1 Tax=Paenibacillus sp. B01 TaxID=2660554 RepID=UPI00129A1835|nr:PCYCGC motif-containing (lipo)protein [Paenibacillus sp. B01]QGG55053.1 hypothetical protein GE073_05290 [Paenibacillus sp. B01]
MRKRLFVSIAAVISATMIVSGCGKNSEHTEHAANGDLRETTTSLAKLPSFLDPLSPSIKTAYSVAASVSDVLPSIPCYCGCGESAGHKHNLNCFIYEIKQDGRVVWDDHGTRCGVCMDTAMKTAAMKEEGKTTLQIRNAIDEMYKEGYAAPTPTPMPVS